MLEAVLSQKNLSPGVKLTVKALIAAAVIALSVTLPQFVHAVGGAEAGMRFLPMYLPILLGGCLLGVRWGVGAAIISPLLSYFITSFSGTAMPSAQRLPFMAAELVVFALICGLFSSKIAKNSWMAFPAVLLASVGGRAFFLAVSAVFENVSSLSAALVWSQIQTGLTGLVIQAVIVPLIVMGISSIVSRDGIK